MKISKPERDRLRDAIVPHDTDYARNQYRNLNIPRSEAVHDINVRYRWDLFYHVRGYKLLDGEYQATHIDTVLRRIVPVL